MERLLKIAPLLPADNCTLVKADVKFSSAFEWIRLGARNIQPVSNYVWARY